MVNPDWKKIDSMTYATRNIQAAFRFKDYADTKCNIVFDRLMLTKTDPPLHIAVPSGLSLYPFQSKKGVPHILSHNKSYIAHAPGLGKSAQAICAVNSSPGRTLIICPSFLKINWAREITKWSYRDFPSIAIVPETLAQDETEWGADYLIVSDSMIIKEWVRRGILTQDFKFVFVDEGHRFKAHDSSRSVALFGGQTEKIKSPGLIYRSEHVCILSGTPLLNRPIELWPVLYAMAPELIDFQSYQNFGFKYGGAIQDGRGHWKFVGSCNEEELKTRIMGRFMQRIRKEDVLKDLPDKVREAVFLDQDTRAEDVKALDQKLQAKLKKSDFQRPQALGEYAILRHQNGLAKVVWAARFVEQILNSEVDEQVIVYAHHKDVVELLRRALIPHLPMVINGETAMDVRTKIQDLFQQGRRRLIIGNIDAMSLGITLTKATRVVFVEYSWTPSSNEQAEDRAHRIGQKDSVFCQYLVLPNSLDEVILNSVLSKEEKIARVID